MATLIEFSVRIFHPSEFFSVRPRSTFPVELLVPSVVHFSTSLSFRSSWTGHSVGLCGSCEVLVLGVCQSFVLSGDDLAVKALMAFSVACPTRTLDSLAGVSVNG